MIIKPNNQIMRKKKKNTNRTNGAGAMTHATVTARRTSGKRGEDEINMLNVNYDNPALWGKLSEKIIDIINNILM